MASIAELMDFLMSLMRDEETRNDFNRDPDATLADRGLEDTTAQDVRDARLMMTDTGAVHPRPGTRQERSSGSDNDPVREINHTTTHFEVGDVTTTVITINDNDTVIVDSFNNDVVAIQDNDTTDIDVISIEDNDTVAEEEEEEEAAAGAGAGLGEDLPGSPAEGASEPEEGAGSDAKTGEDPGSTTGSDAPTGLGVGGGLDAAPGFGPGGEAGSEAPPDEGTGSETVTSFEEPGEFASGAGEGFAPDLGSGFGVQPELDAEAGFTTEEPTDELVG